LAGQPTRVATLDRFAAAMLPLAVPQLFERAGTTWAGFDECFFEAELSEQLEGPMAIGHRGNKLTIQVRCACLPRPCFCSEPALDNDQPLRFSLVAAVRSSCPPGTGTLLQGDNIIKMKEGGPLNQAMVGRLCAVLRQLLFEKTGTWYTLVDHRLFRYGLKVEGELVLVSNRHKDEPAKLPPYCQMLRTVTSTEGPNYPPGKRTGTRVLAGSGSNVSGIPAICLSLHKNRCQLSSSESSG
jgi:hypothetical protein